MNLFLAGACFNGLGKQIILKKDNDKTLRTCGLLQWTLIKQTL